jgi:hypothetical protein
MLLSPRPLKKLKNCDLGVFLELPKGVLELSLHGLDIWILDEELGAELTELSELDLPATVLVDLLE